MVFPPSLAAHLDQEFGSLKTWVDNDIANFYQKLGTKSGKDAQQLLNLLKSFKEQDSEFYYEITVDEHSHLEHVLFMFPEQKVLFHRFHDVVIFDCTYHSNRFLMPFGVFSGVDNHGLTVCFAGYLLQNETM